MTLSHVIDACGWTLLHFTWQAGALALLLGCLLRLVPAVYSQARYLSACLALLLMAVAAALTFVWQIQWAPTAAGLPPSPNVSMGEVLTAPPVSAALGSADGAAADWRLPMGVEVGHGLAPVEEFLSPPPLTETLVLWLVPWIGPLVGVWAMGVCLLSLRLFVNWFSVQGLRASGRAITDPAWIRTFAHLQERLAITRPARLMCSGAVRVPMVIGWLKPIVLVPIELVMGLDRAQVEAILAHELAHLRRHDYLVNLLQNVAETLFFYHPAVWWVSGQIRREREYCCDDIAARLCDSPASYARALAVVETMRGTRPALSVAASGGSLLDRVQRLAGRQAQPGVGAGGALTMAIVLGCALLLLADSRGGAAELIEQAAADRLSDEEATAIARKAHRAASQLDTLPRFYCEATTRTGSIKTMQYVEERSIKTLQQALDVTEEVDWFEIKDTVIWDPHRLYFRYSARPRQADGTPRDGRADYFGTESEGWAKEQWDMARPPKFFRRNSIGDFWSTSYQYARHYLGVTPRTFWWGNNHGPNQGTSLVPPDMVTYRYVGTEPLGGELCDVVEAKGRTERLWIGRESGLMRGMAQYFVGGRIPPTFYQSEAVQRITGKTFSSMADYAEWHNEHHQRLSHEHQAELSKAFNEIYFDEFAHAGNLRVYSDYREVAPGVWLPFREDGAVCHPNDDKFQFYRSIRIVDRVALDEDLAERLKELAPQEGDRVQDQRFAATIEYDYDPSLTDEDLAPLVQEKLARLAEGARIMQELQAPVEKMVGGSAPALPVEGWIGNQPLLDGKPYLVHFWATWCGPCKAELPALKQLAKNYQIIGIHPPGTPVDEIEKFLDDEQLGYPTLVAEKSGDELLAGYPVKMYPYYVVVDANGKLAAHGRLGPQLMAALRKSDADGETSDDGLSALAEEPNFTYVDLKTKATHSLAKEFGNDGRIGNVLTVPLGEQIFKKVKFNIGEGVIQLGSRVWHEKPEKVEGIEVGRKFAKLHILHATGYGGGPNAPGTAWHVEDGTRIGQYTVHYDDGSSKTIPIVYGEDVRDWWFREDEKKPSRGNVAWVGDNPLASQYGCRLRLYLTTWENPIPEKKVVAIDYVGRKEETAAAPFCVAMSLEGK